MSIGYYAAQNYQYPLDMVSSCAMAYSIRQLSKSWSTRIMTIRRASDNATTDLSFDTNGKISNSSPVSAGGTLGTWGSTTNCFIQTWYDQSGHTNDVTQATLAAQPQLTSSGTVLTPGPLFVLSPTVTFLTITALTQGTLNLPFTSFYASEINTSTLGNYTVSDSNNTTRYTLRYANSGSAENPLIGAITGTTVLSANTFYLISGFNASSGTTGSIYVNGIFDSSTTAANTTALNGVSLGRITPTSGQFSGYISEVITYNSTLSTTQFQALNANMKNFYGIP